MVRDLRHTWIPRFSTRWHTSATPQSQSAQDGAQTSTPQVAVRRVERSVIQVAIDHSAILLSCLAPIAVPLLKLPRYIFSD